MSYTDSSLLLRAATARDRGYDKRARKSVADVTLDQR